MRDPAGIRPAFYYQDEEVLVVASERPVIQTAFNIPISAVQEIKPGHALIAKKDGTVTEEVLLGHLRYGTHGKNSIESCHPFLRQNNWMSRNLVVAGNFNMTNVDELLQQLYELGQHPKEQADTVTVLEKIGHFLDNENQQLFDQFKSEGYSNIEISSLIAKNLDVPGACREESLFFRTYLFL